MNKLKLYCTTNKPVNFLENTNINLAWVGLDKKPQNYIGCDNKDNIFYKEKYYSELTFHYWYWKNLFNINDNSWIGFCQKRRFWIKENTNIDKIDKNNINKHLLLEPLKEWKNYDSIICKPIVVSEVKTMKLIKRGWKNLIKDPSILFNNKKKNIALHFDMHHGYGNLDLAINELKNEDKEDFYNFVYNENSFNPHIMFIARPKILDKWFAVLFEWLFKCEKKIGLEKLKGYDTTRLYAYLAERYLSFWFKKYTNYKEHSWLQLDNF